MDKENKKAALSENELEQIAGGAEYEDRGITFVPKPPKYEYKPIYEPPVPEDSGYVPFYDSIDADVSAYKIKSLSDPVQ